MNNKLLMTHDIACTLGALGSAACRYTRPLMLSSSGPSATADLAVAAIAFTIQLAIETGRDPDDLRALERELIAAVTGETSP